MKEMQSNIYDLAQTYGEQASPEWRQYAQNAEASMSIANQGVLEVLKDLYESHTHDKRQREMQSIRDKSRSIANLSLPKYISDMLSGRRLFPV